MNQFYAIDFGTADGDKLKRHLEERLEQLRIQNEDATKDSTETALIRGAIKEIRRLLAPAAPQMKGLTYHNMDNRGRG